MSESDDVIDTPEEAITDDESETTAPMSAGFDSEETLAPLGTSYIPVGVTADIAWDA